MYVTSYIAGLNNVLQHSSFQESCLGCRMTSSFTMVCIPHALMCVICWVMLLGYIQTCCLLVLIICVCVKDVRNIVKDVGRHFTDSYTGGGIILLVCGTVIC